MLRRESSWTQSGRTSGEDRLSQCVRFFADRHCLQEYFLQELSPAVLPAFRRTLQTLQELGATLTSVSLPSTPLALSAYYVIASAEASSNLARFDGTRYGESTSLPFKCFAHSPACRGEGCRGSASKYARRREQPLVRYDALGRLWEGGSEAIASWNARVVGRVRCSSSLFDPLLTLLCCREFDNYFLQAQRVRRMVQLEFDAVFRATNPLSSTTSHQRDDADRVDLIVHPSAIGTAPLASTYPGSPTAGYVQDVLNVPSSLAGLPAMSVPVGKSEEGWPIGVQLVGQWGSEELVLKVGELLEQ